MDLVNWWVLMCCWCCGGKDKDEQAYDAAEKERKQEMEAKKVDEASIVHEQPAERPRLFHAPKPEA
jgi:hypothetical protein